MRKGVNGTDHLRPIAAAFTSASIESQPMSHGAMHPMRDAFRLGSIEADRLLRVIAQSMRTRSHYDLFRLLQGEVQFFIPHQILICAWGDFHGANLKLDVTSALPGVRTIRLKGCNIDGLIKALYVRWLTLERHPMLLDTAAHSELMRSDCNCALHKSLQDMNSILVHGIHDARDGFDTLYLAANAGPIAREISIEGYFHLLDPIIAQIDGAFRRVVELKIRGIDADARPPLSSDVLSARESEILRWISSGRSNAEISKILDISAFTVKNHVQRILKKLGANNRAEAVAKYRHSGRPIRTNGSARRGAVLAAE